MKNLSPEQVLKALNFQPPDRVPHYDLFLDGFIEKWKIEKKTDPGTEIDDYYDNDIFISKVPDEAWPSKAGILKKEGTYVIYRDSWGMVQRQLSDAHGELRDGYAGQELEVACKEKIDPDRLEFESPHADYRHKETSANVKKYSDRYAIFCKVGGPYSRTSRLRGTEQFLIDIAEDPEYAKALVEKVTDHITMVGLEHLRRDDFTSSGIWIFDDIADNNGLIMGPRHYEHIFYPSLVKMVQAFKEAGVSKVLMHSDGNIESVLDMFIEAGIDGINPVEPKAAMDIVKLRKKYGGRLSFIGGMCNSFVLPKGSKEEITKQVRMIVELGKEGGVIFGSHSIGADVPIENYDLAIRIYREIR